MNRFRRIAQTLAAACIAVLAAGGLSAQGASPGPLDGLRFTARIVKDDGITPADPLIDTLLFDGGEFSSAICARYNFAPSGYWVRGDGAAVEFLAELTSPTDGRMIWRGTIADGKLTGTMRWTRKRWYRTIDVTHRIRGTVETAAPAAVE